MFFVPRRVGKSLPIIGCRSQFTLRFKRLGPVFYYYEVIYLAKGSINTTTKVRNETRRPTSMRFILPHNLPPSKGLALLSVICLCSHASFRCAASKPSCNIPHSMRQRMDCTLLISNFRLPWVSPPKFSISLDKAAGAFPTFSTAWLIWLHIRRLGVQGQAQVFYGSLHLSKV